MAFSPPEYCRLFAQKKACQGGGGSRAPQDPPLATPLVCIVCFVLQGSAYVPRDDLVSLVANEFRVQLSRALAVGISCFFDVTYY